MITWQAASTFSAYRLPSCGSTAVTPVRSRSPSTQRHVAHQHAGDVHERASSAGRQAADAVAQLAEAPAHGGHHNLPACMGAIVARAPLRVALGGGGTDLPSYYREHGGFVVSTAIDRYVHMLVSDRLPAPLPAEAPGVGGGRRPGRGPPPDPARGARPPLGRRPAGAGLGRRRAAGHGPRLLGRLRGLRDRGARELAGARARAGASSPRPPARSRSTCSAARSASRTSTPPRSAVPARTASTPTTRVDVRELDAARARSRARCARSSCSSSPAASAPPPTCSRGRAPATRAARARPAPELARETCAALEARRPRRAAAS